MPQSLSQLAPSSLHPATENQFATIAACPALRDKAGAVLELLSEMPCMDVQQMVVMAALEGLASSAIEGITAPCIGADKLAAQCKAGEQRGAERSRLPKQWRGCGAQHVIGNCRAVLAATQSDLPFSIRLLRSIHREVAAGRASYLPSEFRHYQVVIYGEGGEIVWAPPHHSNLIELLGALELVLWKRGGLPPVDRLIDAIVAHEQFESIHPFADGNGRTGRAILVKQISDLAGEFSGQQNCNVIIPVSVAIQRERYLEHLRMAREDNEGYRNYVDFMLDALTAAIRGATRLLAQCPGNAECTWKKLAGLAQEYFQAQACGL